jgi:nicotinate phosphoribosyltransferase
MVVSWDAPSLDSVYKLVAVGDRPGMRLSEGKVTAPAAKHVFGSWEAPMDVIALADEPSPPGFEAPLSPVLVGGQCTSTVEALSVSRERLRRDLSRLPAKTTALRRPRQIPVGWSERLDRLTRALSTQLATGEQSPGQPSLRAARADPQEDPPCT